jgi:GrpB-like predicted nucleotidyltransferase (UPF0157 family)
MTGAPVHLVAYDDAWPRRFADECALLEDVLAPWLRGGVHHIGSTAVPGLSAKPILDMMAGVRDLTTALAASVPLQRIGYESGSHRPHEAHWFFKPAGASVAEQTHALHLTEVGSALWRERLGFRDALRADPGLLLAYADLKRRLALEHDDIASYTKHKREFVAQVLATVGISLAARQGP